MRQNTHLTKTDHCKYLREESLKNIHGAKKKKKNLNSSPLEVSQMLQGVMRDNFLYCLLNNTLTLIKFKLITKGK